MPFHNLSPSLTLFRSSRVENEAEPAVQLFANYAHGRTRTADAVLQNDVEIFDLSLGELRP